VRVAHVLTQATGGPVQVATGLVRGLRARGHDARLFGPPPRIGGGADVPVTEAVVASTRDLDGYRALRRAVAAFAPDVVHAQDRRAALAVGLGAAAGAPAVTTYHGVPDACVARDGRLGIDGRPLTPRARGALLADAALARRFRRVTTPSADMARYLADVVGVPATRVVVVPNAVAPPGADARPGAAATAPRPVRLLGTLTSFATAKATPALVAAFLDVARDRPALRLVLAGDGPDRPACEALAAASDVGGQVAFAGHTDDPRAFLRGLDAFVLPSVEENLPLALLEAMAEGLPCIATDVGGVAEVLADGVGLLVPPRDPAALTAALRSLADDPALAARLGSDAAHAVAERWTLDGQVAGMLAVYEEVAR
jgi:glycosyltransferase involved in cell wall biosynthesis